MRQNSEKLLPCGRPSIRTHKPIRPEKLAQWKEILLRFLSDEGLKYSEQRWKIAELILTTGGHLDSQKIVERVKQHYPEIGAATVYRNIKVLCDAAILKESLMDSQGRIIYELYDDEHHDHIICLDCGEIFEFHDDRIESEQLKITEKMKFEQVRHRHVLYAKCRYSN